MTTLLLDPFDTTPDAQPGECETRTKSRFAQKYVDPLGNSGAKPKNVDFNPIQQRWFRANGWTFYRAEKANAWGRVSQDMWTCADYVACHPEHGILLVQTCRKSDMATRLRKAEAVTELRAWLAAGGHYEVHGWEKEGARWQVKRTAVQLIDGALVRVVVVDRRAGA